MSLYIATLSFYKSLFDRGDGEKKDAVIACGETLNDCMSELVRLALGEVWYTCQITEKGEKDWKIQFCLETGQVKNESIFWGRATMKAPTKDIDFEDPRDRMIFGPMLLSKEEKQIFEVETSERCYELFHDVCFRFKRGFKCEEGALETFCSFIREFAAMSIFRYDIKTGKRTAIVGETCDTPIKGNYDGRINHCEACAKGVKFPGEEETVVEKTGV